MLLSSPRRHRAAAENTATPRLSVLSYNVFLMSKNLYPNWGQDHRAAEIPKTSFYKGHDVVVLQEPSTTPPRTR